MARFDVGHYTGVSGATYSGNFPGPSWTGTGNAICPDLLTIHQLGVADNFRGRVVRGFFRVLEWLPL